MPGMKETMHNEIILRVDAKGRINLGKWAKGISSFRVTRRPDGVIVLTPYVEILLDMLKKLQKTTSDA